MEVDLLKADWLRATSLVKRRDGLRSRIWYSFPNPLIALVDLAAQRLQTAEGLAVWKFQAAENITDSRREQEVIDAAAQRAIANDVEPGYVRDVFRDLIDATVALQHGRFARWKLDPGSVPTGAPNLLACRRIIDAISRAAVDEIARRWTLLKSPTYRTELEDAKAIVIKSRQLDSTLQASLAYATRKYCRVLPRSA
ncbi:chorismate mutase [Mycobacterium sp. 3519A]|uniref:chorismate mutase n=1 Tax=Mycobacterium sp. 3519A TaxID=2057184 RepID=UPI001359F324|nr:chorismate mutase [Mycobacterium sp. 3519A]